MISVVSFVFVIAILAYFLLALAFILDDYIIGMFAGMAIFCIGLYVAIYNIESINNLITQFFAVVSIWLGLYIFINISKEKIEGLM